MKVMAWLHSLLQGRKDSEDALQPEAEGAALDAPFEIHRVHGKEALTHLLALRRERGAMFPLVMGDRSEVEQIFEVMTFNAEHNRDYLKDGLMLDVKAWVQQRFDEDPTYFSTGEDHGGAPTRVEPLSLTREVLTGKPKREIFTGILPVQNSWEVPAYLRIGDWNDCPSAEVHVAFFKHWAARYGAVVAGMSRDTIEFLVERPPSTMAEARQLAREQFAYCGDIVHQGVGTEENLAKVLLGAGNWFFWWD